MRSLYPRPRWPLPLTRTPGVRTGMHCQGGEMSREKINITEKLAGCYEHFHDLYG